MYFTADMFAEYSLDVKTIWNLSLGVLGIKSVAHPVCSSDFAPGDFWFFPQADGEPRAFWRHWADEGACEKKSWTLSIWITSRGLHEVIAALQGQWRQRIQLWRRLVLYTSAKLINVSTEKVTTLLKCT